MKPEELGMTKHQGKLFVKDNYYYCDICNHLHSINSKIGNYHIEHEREVW